MSFIGKTSFLSVSYMHFTSLVRLLDLISIKQMASYGIFSIRCLNLVSKCFKAYWPFACINIFYQISSSRGELVIGVSTKYDSFIFLLLGKYVFILVRDVTSSIIKEQPRKECLPIHFLCLFCKYFSTYISNNV